MNELQGFLRNSYVILRGLGEAGRCVFPYARLNVSKLTLIQLPGFPSG